MNGAAAATSGAAGSANALLLIGRGAFLVVLIVFAVALLYALRQGGGDGRL